jgi:excinuclease ABC subunit A
MQTIRIRGARTHNLKNIDLDLPRERLIVLTGLSGSGKSSLAFDTVYAEGQRRYVESLSAYARQFLSMMEKPDVDSIEGLSPAISIEQKSTSHNPRSTVATVTEIYDYLRLLYARAGIPRCPDHGLDLAAQTVSQMVDQVLELPEGAPLLLLAPVIKERKGEHAQVLDELKGKGFVRARIDGKVVELDDPPALDLRRKHTIEAVVDRFKVRADLSQRLAESFETALRLGGGIASIAFLDDPKRAELVFSDKFACNVCGWSLAELEPRLFSFNNPAGACPACDGLGQKQFFDPARVVTQPHLSLAAGAVRGWDRRNAYYFTLIQSLARHYKFDVEAPWRDIDPQGWNTILTGRRFGATFAMSLPPIMMLPSSGAMKPAIIRSSVVLPQPDGPRMEKKLPRATLNERASTAVCEPKRLTTLRASRSGVLNSRPSRDRARALRSLQVRPGSPDTT